MGKKILFVILFLSIISLLATNQTTASNSNKQAISDSFTLNNSSRVKGGGLNGLTTETGGAIWNAGKGVKFTAAGTITCSATKKGGASVKVPTSWNIIEVSAKINPTSTGWTGVALGQNLQTWDVNKEILVYLRPNGGYGIFRNGTQCKSAVSPDFVSGGFNDVVLLYNKSDNTITVTINNTVVMNAYDLGADSYTPTIINAGVFFASLVNDSSQPQVDDFSVVNRRRSTMRDTVTASAKTKMSKSDYLIYTKADTFDEILPTTKPSMADVKKKIRIFAAPGEYESLSFAIYAQKNLRYVEMEIGDLVSRNGDVIPKSNLDLRAVTCLPQTRKIPAATKAKKKDLIWVPELLEKKITFISPNTSQQFWLTVNVPRSAKAGIYKSVLRVKPINAAEQNINIVVEILPFSLEKSDRQFGLYHHRIDRQELLENRRIKTLENYEKDLRLMREYGVEIIVSSRLSLIGIEKQGNQFKIDYSRVIEFFDLCDKVGIKKLVLIPGPINLTPIKNFGRVVNLEKKLQYDLLAQVTKEVHNLHKKKAYAFDLLWAGLDEVHWRASKHKNPGLITEAIKLITTLRKAVPSIKIYQTYCAEHPSSFEKNRKLNELVDVKSYAGIMERMTDTRDLYNYYKKTEKKIAAKGGEMWCYNNTHSYKRFHVEEERLANGFWLWRTPFKVNIPCQGQIYFGNPYIDNDKNRFGESMTIFYPSIIDGSPIPTITLAAYREGIDDLRYINTLETAIARCKKKNIKPAEVAAAEKLLKQLGEKLDSLRILSKMAKAFEPKDYKKMRRKIAKAIVSLQ